MAIVARGKIMDIKEHTWESSRGPQTDHIANLVQDGQDRPTPVLISYKIVDEVMLLIGKQVDAVLYLASKGGKKGPWTQVIVVAATVVK